MCSTPGGVGRIITASRRYFLSARNCAQRLAASEGSSQAGDRQRVGRNEVLNAWRRRKDHHLDGTERTNGAREGATPCGVGRIITRWAWGMRGRGIRAQRLAASEGSSPSSFWANVTPFSRCSTPGGVGRIITLCVGCGNGNDREVLNAWRRRKDHHLKEATRK